MEMAGDRLRVEEHAGCVVCGIDNATGFQITYTTEAPGRVSALWTPATRYEGFKGLVHGGVLATVLDEAMSKAVAATGCEALTAELRVRFRRHIASGRAFRVRGWIVKHGTRIVETEASLTALDGSEHAHARAKFLALRKANA